MHRAAPAAVVALALAVLPAAGAAQEGPAAEQEVIAVAHAALEAISNEDLVGFTDLMLEGANIVALPGRDRPMHISTREEMRSGTMDADYVERGFNPRARVQGDLATVWMPYDFYTDGAWSHCGIDLFTLVRVDGRWLISSLAYTVEQPPACTPHPAGPPGV